MRLYFIYIVLFFFIANHSFAENKLVMITDERCIYCIMWEKQIGKIYHKTDIAENFPLHRIEIKDEKNIYLQAKVTPTFIFLVDSNEKGRITGYSYPEMFWWQVDEILER